MLYDAFICHASEDKDSFVRALAARLREEHVEVWYDDFSLALGDSIRGAIDKGLRQSRFGVVILSPAFFAKNWPQYELDGLVDREMAGNDKIILPVWHDVDHDEVAKHSPSLAARYSVQSSRGLAHVVDEILKVVRPSGSPLIVARDILLEYGITPPVITDKYWLDVVEASNRVPATGATVPEEAAWDRWSFPLPNKEGGAEAWGDRLAWTAMQLRWTKAADEAAISPMKRPEEVLRFIRRHPGLLDACDWYPALTAEYAPQLTIPGFGGELEPAFEEGYQKSHQRQQKLRDERSRSGSALTTSGLPPTCDEEWIFRDEALGEYEAGYVSYAYFHGGTFGPPVSPFEDAEHAIWLISRASSWLPQHIHSVILDGTRIRAQWCDDNLYATWRTHGALFNALFSARERGRRFEWTRACEDDLLHRIELAAHRLSLPEAPQELFAAFRASGFVEAFLIQRKRRTKAASK